MTETVTTTWRNCYNGSLKELITPEAFAHPAKMSRKLCERIFDHGLEKGYWRLGDIIIDPFGGIGTTGLIGAYRGYRVIGVELEERFVKLAQENIERNRRKIKRLGNPLPVIIQGDSRELGKVIVEAAGAMTSPPWFGVSSDGGWQMLDKYAEEGKLTVKQVEGDPNKSFPSWSKDRDTSYGKADGQIANLPEGSHDEIVGAITSPPFLQTRGGDHVPKGMEEVSPGFRDRHLAGNRGVPAYGETAGQLHNLPEGDHDGVMGAISSPPYATMPTQKNSDSINLEKQFEMYRNSGGGQSFEKFEATQKKHSQGYGDHPDQLAHLPEGDHAQIAGAISSPPYSEARIGTASGQEHVGREENYGQADGQLGNMAEGDISEVTGAITSPPYEDSNINPGNVGNAVIERWGSGGSLAAGFKDGYGASPNQLGTLSGDTYWSAVAVIYQQVYDLLPPGGAFAVVVKDFVRNKQRVPLCDQTAELLEAVGFAVPERIRAMLVREVPQPINMFTGEIGIKLVERKSFFRRLAEKKGSPRIDWEEVIWAVKP